MKKLISVILTVCLICICVPPVINTDAALRYNYLKICGNTDSVAGNWSATELTSDDSDPTVTFDYTVPDGGVTVIVLTYGTYSECTKLLQGISNTEWISNDKINIVLLDIMFNPAATRSEMVTLRDCLGEYAGKACVFYNNPNPGWCYVNYVLGEAGGISPPVLMLVTETDSVKTVRYYGTGNITMSTLQNSLAALIDSVPYDDSTAVSDITVTGDMLYDTVYEIYEMVNQQRAENNVPSIALSETLTRFAMQRAAECSAYYSHTRPNGEACFTVDADGSYTVGYINAENIAAGQKTSAEVMEDWMNSAGHRYNILNPNSDSIGIGAYRNAGRIYWVQLFGTGSDPTAPTITGTVHMNVEVEAAVANLTFKYPTVTQITLNAGESAEIPLMGVFNKTFYSIPSDIIPFTYGTVKDASGTVIATVGSSGSGKTVTALMPGEGDLLLYAYEGHTSPHVIHVTVTGDIKFGDADGDGIVTGRDLIRLRKYLNSPGSSVLSAGADANGDGAVDGLDLIALRKYLAGFNDDTGVSSYTLGPR